MYCVKGEVKKLCLEAVFEHKRESGGGGSELIATVDLVCGIISGMRKSRVNFPNRCYHLIRRVAHRAFFLDDGERRDHPNSPRQKYALTKAGSERIRRVAPL